MYEIKKFDELPGAGRNHFEKKALKSEGTFSKQQIKNVGRMLVGTNLIRGVNKDIYDVYPRQTVKKGFLARVKRTLGYERMPPGNLDAIRKNILRED